MCTVAASGWWFLWPLCFFGFWIVVGVTLRFGMWGRHRSMQSGRWHPNHSAEGILAERFARDELTEQEYRDRLNVIRFPRTAS